MRKRPTPSPDPKSRIGCLSVATIIGLFGILISIQYNKYWVLIFTLPILILMYGVIKSKLILLIAIRLANEKLIYGVLITSDSPKWKEYIEYKWIPRIGSSLEVLNWSKHNTWKQTIYTKLFNNFVGTEENFCPSVVMLRGLKEPLVFRFYYAFRDAKYGNIEALNKLEQRLFKELEFLRGT